MAVFLRTNMAISENTIPPAALTVSDLPALPPLQLIWQQGEPSLPGGSRPDALLSIRYGKLARTFVAEYKPRWDARTLEAAIRQARKYAEASSDAYPLVVLPYLSSDHLNVLLAAEVSGVDLCGNALIMAQGNSTRPDWFLRFTGQPNRFRQGQGLSAPYEGKAALVARTLLSVPIFPNAGALQAEVKRRGGQVSQPVVSRALRAFQDDLVVSAGKRGQGIAVVQPEKLLDRLVEGWQASTGGLARKDQRLLWQGKVNLPPEQLLSTLTARARQSGQRFTATGLVTAAQYTNLSSGGEQSAYVDSVGDLLDGLDAQETRRFPNLELWRVPNEAVFFDTSAEEEIVFASPLQTYLELATGDARTQQAALPLRKALLERLEKKVSSLRAGEQS